MKKFILIIFFLATMVLSVYSPCYGFEFFDNLMMDLDEELEDGSYIGIGALYSQEHYIGVDEDINVVPIIDAEYKNLFIDNTIFGYHFYKEGEITLSLVGSPRLWGYEADDSPELNGMQDRDWSLDGGARLKWKNDWFTLKLTGLTDLLGEHDGQEGSISLSKAFFEGGLTPRIKAQWYSDDLINHYYGVTATEVAIARPQYEPGESFSYSAGVSIAIPLDERWAVVGDIQYEVLDDEIEDSPLVDDNEVFRFVSGLIYRF